MAVKDIRGYAQVGKAAAYAGVCKRTFEEWLKAGLPYVKLPSGTRLVAYRDIDRWLEQFRKGGSEIEQLADRLLEDF